MKSEPCSWHVSYRRAIEYDIVNTAQLFDPQNPALLSVGNRQAARRFVVVDANVERLYAAQMRAYFAQHGVQARIVSFPGGEQNKSVDWYLSILKELDDFPIRRRDEPIIAIGGGVLTDVVAFVAGSYRRSVPHIKVPTTLMGYVDASVGIKTGLNFNGHKNRLGSFEAPLRVLLDRAFLTSLPRRHILNGVCEMIKLAVIKDIELFDLLEQHGAQSVAAHFQDGPGGAMLDRAITGMLAELQPNLFEDELARRVDFGHTFSYGLETRHEAQLLHGEAVLLDILLSLLISGQRGLSGGPEIERVFGLVEQLGIAPETSLLEPILLWSSLEERVRHRNGFQRVPMPAGLGQCIFLDDIRPAEIEAAVRQLKQRMAVQHEHLYERR